MSRATPIRGTRMPPRRRRALGGRVSPGCVITINPMERRHSHQVDMVQWVGADAQTVHDPGTPPGLGDWAVDMRHHVELIGMVGLCALGFVVAMVIGILCWG